MKEQTTENSIMIYKDLLPQPINLIKGIRLNIKRRLSDYIFKEVDYNLEKDKKAHHKKQGSHSLSSLHHFQTYHK